MALRMALAMRIGFFAEAIAVFIKHAIASHFHGDGRIGSGTYAGIDDDGHLRIFDNLDEIPFVLNAQARTNGRCKRHHGDATDGFKLLWQ